MLYDKLYDFQKESVSKLKEMGRGLLCDEMGLGKSLQALALMEILLRENKTAAVICPAYLRQNWAKEMTKEISPGLKTSDATNRELWKKKTKYCLKELSILGEEINGQNDAEINIDADQDSNE